MKAAMTLGMATLLVTAGAAVADGPMSLSEAQMDQVTAGVIAIKPPPFPQSFEVMTGAVDLNKVLIALSQPSPDLIAHVEGLLPAVQEPPPFAVK